MQTFQQDVKSKKHRREDVNKSIKILLVKNKFNDSKELNSLLVNICLCFLSNFLQLSLKQEL